MRAWVERGKNADPGPPQGKHLATPLVQGGADVSLHVCRGLTTGILFSFGHLGTYSVD